MILAAALIVIVAVGSAALFMLSNKQTVAARGRQEQQAAISDDLAMIQRLNDRYNCKSGTCSVATSDPGENDYYPTGTGVNTTFDDLCSSGELLNNLLEAIDAADTPASFANLDISRQDAEPDSDDPSTNRYTVTWVNGRNSVLRQITLVPTVANWCP